VVRSSLHILLRSSSGRLHNALIEGLQYNLDSGYRGSIAIMLEQVPGVLVVTDCVGLLVDYLFISKTADMLWFGFEYY
jgi:hypothetical protein